MRLGMEGWPGWQDASGEDLKAGSIGPEPFCLSGLGPGS